ncbi:hypothetical protein JCM19992_34850 [Thermostilla marina]
MTIVCPAYLFLDIGSKCVALHYVSKLNAQELELLDKHMQHEVDAAWQSYAQTHWSQCHDDFGNYEGDGPYEPPPRWRFRFRTLAELQQDPETLLRIQSQLQDLHRLVCADCWVVPLDELHRVTRHLPYELDAVYRDLYLECERTQKRILKMRAQLTQAELPVPSPGFAPGPTDCAPSSSMQVAALSQRGGQTQPPEGQSQCDGIEAADAAKTLGGLPAPPEAQTESEIAEPAPELTERGEDQQSPKPTRHYKQAWLAAALEIVKDDPFIADAEVARRVKVSPSTICRNETYQAFKLAAQKAARQPSRKPRGFVAIDDEGRRQVEGIDKSNSGEGVEF